MIRQWPQVSFVECNPNVQQTEGSDTLEMTVLVVPKTSMEKKRGHNSLFNILKLGVSDIKYLRRKNSCAKSRSISLSEGSKNFPLLRKTTQESTPYGKVVGHNKIRRRMDPRMQKLQQLIQTKKVLKLRSRISQSGTICNKSVLIPSTPDHQFELFSNQRIKAELGGSRNIHIFPPKTSLRKPNDSMTKPCFLRSPNWKLRKGLLYSKKQLQIKGTKFDSNIKKFRSKSRCIFKMSKTDSIWAAHT
ncbi:unnamed protein product [Moneuplotes crassus]|uniref:Uncharacterized protein n=1 Tax=Euplotes crassus TaxID=5936 RepID=A0AAD2CYD8_EUPCR|nr:unnamed protein product [Moneuplotes crassus]